MKNTIKKRVDGVKGGDSPLQSAILQTNPFGSILLGFVLVVIGFGGFVAWAFMAPLDEGVVTQGVVNVDSKRKTIQHLRGGTVKDILVRDGDKVAKGAPLIRLDDAQMVQSKRMLVEQIKGLEQVVIAKSRQMASLNEELSVLRKLFDQGYVPRNRLFDLERALAELTGSKADNIANIAANKERLAATQDEIDNSVIRSPVEGMVMGMNVHTIGGVVNPSEKLMDIVPEDALLIIDTTIPTHVIDKVREGLMVEVRFTALNQKTTPTVEGEVVFVSADSLVDQRTGAAFYTARVKVPEEAMKKVGKHRIQPGMPVDITIITGERTMMEYLMKPLSDRMARSLKEV